MSATVRVELPQAAYEIAIAAGGLAQLGQAMRDRAQLTNRRVLLVSNPTVFAPYGDRAIAALTAAGYDVATCLLPDGEPHKTLASVQQIYDAAIAHRLERSSTMVALGGGVIGDMTGFAAATWLRGLNFVQVPTTLLAMVDAAIGGKTGVNHPQGKNLIGAFHQPKLVLIDPTVLATLPVREFRAGMAEVIKYGVIWDEQLFTQLEQAPGLDALETVGDLIDEILLRSCQAKADVVRQDEKEGGLRAILNYGHTIAHAIESLTGYGRVVHGEAVAIGMVAAGEIAVDLQMWPRDCANRQHHLIVRSALPTTIPTDLDPDAIVAALSLDKKVKDGQVRFILPTKIGGVEIVAQVPPTTIKSVITRMRDRP